MSYLTLAPQKSGRNNEMFDSILQDPQTVRNQDDWSDIEKCRAFWSDVEYLQPILEGVQSVTNSTFMTAVQEKIFEKLTAENRLYTITAHPGSGKSLGLAILSVITVLQANSRNPTSRTVKVLWVVSSHFRAMQLKHWIEIICRNIEVASDIYAGQPDIMTVCLDREQIKKRLSTLLQTQSQASQIKMLIIDDAEEILNSKQNRAFLGVSVILHILQHQLENIPVIYFTQNYPDEAVIKFTNEVEANFCKQYLKGLNPIHITYPISLIQTIDQFYTELLNLDFMGTIRKIISHEDHFPLAGGMLVFCNSEEEFKSISEIFSSYGTAIDAVNSMRDEETSIYEKLKAFKDGEIRVLMCGNTLLRKYQPAGVGVVIMLGVPSSDGMTPDAVEYDQRIACCSSPVKNAISVIILRNSQEVQLLRALENQIGRAIKPL
ncbi:unnamed protein product [Blepharisma stoltei]|uniref:ATP-dependent RNA helicase n=1 Tax=Blepharisma stoltei TaxID=1481888 RepID=A0AAU9IGR0_9CILI|nr:unnamed protein product [Blepharisma stoltei]